MMRKLKTLIVAVILVLAVSGFAIAKPVAVIDKQVYTFDPVPDGVYLEHEYIIRNTGDTNLEIENVLPP